MIVLGIDEADLCVAAERLRGARVHVVGLELGVLPVDEVVAVGRDADDVLPDQLALFDQCPLAGRRVDAIDVRRGELVIGDVGARVAADRPPTILTDLDVTHRAVGKANEARRADVEAFAIREVAIGVGAGHLHRLNAIVLRVPDVDVRDFIGTAATCRVGRRHLLLHREEDALAIVAQVEPPRAR